MKKKPSLTRTAKGLWQLAYKIEHRSTLVSELGQDSHARALRAAASACSSAAIALEELAAIKEQRG